MYQRYALPLYNYAIRSWLIDADSAWDIIYKVLFRITERINEYSFKNEDQFRNMLYTVFNNELINFYHKTKRIEKRLKLLRFDEAFLEQAGSGTGPTTLNEINEKILKKGLEDFRDAPEGENPLLDILGKLLDELEDWERILINQRSKGISYHDIAEFVDKPENQLKVYYGRLKNRLQMKLLERMKEMKNG